MSDRRIAERIAELAAQYPTLSQTPKESLVVDQDGLLASEQAPEASHPDDFVPNLDDEVHSGDPTEEIRNRLSGDDFYKYLNLTVPGQVPDRIQLISRMVDGINSSDPVQVAEAVRDLIFAATCHLGARHRRGSRSRTRIVHKPPFNDVKAKLSGLLTKSKLPMFSEKWISQIYENCEASTLDKLLRTDRVGNLALALKGASPRRFNERVSRHLDLVG